VADEKKTEAAAPQTVPAQAQQATPPQLDETSAQASYCNYCRVTGTPEEMILDCCLSTNPQPGQQVNMKVQNRIVMSFYTAKRLLAALHMAVQRHEGAFGVLETDVTKRLTPGAAQAAAQAAQNAQKTN
jgi:uncharacterized protein DUF3467